MPRMKMRHLGILAFALCSLAWASRAQTPVFSVLGNTTANYTDSTGQVWVQQTQCVTPGGTFAVTNAIAKALPAATDQKLYNQEAWGAMTCTFTVPNGNYNVRLKEAELYYTPASGNCSNTACTGQRLFNLTINGTAVLTNYDIVAAAGGALIAIDRVFAVPVTNGSIVMTFAVGTQNQPKFDAIQITPASTVAAPTNLGGAVTTGGNAVLLTWAYTATATNYDVYRSTVSGNGPWTQIATPTAKTYTDTPVTPGTYFYYVTAIVGGAQSPGSNIISVTVAGPTLNSMVISGTPIGGSVSSITLDPTKSISVSTILSNALTVTGTVVPQTITSVTPNTGPNGTIVTVAGTGFMPNSTVTLICPSATGTNFSATNVQQTGSTQLVANVPTLPTSIALPVSCDVRVDP